MKKFAKTNVIVMMAVVFALTLLVAGCESQQEKYTKASNELAAYEIEWLQNLKVKIDKIVEDARKSNTGNDDKSLDELRDMANKSLDEYEKNVKEKLENLQKIAKGNPELENDVRNKWNEFNRKRLELYSARIDIDKIVEGLKIQK